MEKLNLRQKLIKIRASIEYIQKTEKGDKGVMYVDPAILLQKIRSGMADYSVNLSPNIVSCDVFDISAPTKNNKDNKGYFCKMPMLMVWQDGDSDETIECSWFATAKHISDPGMCMGSALTYSERYFLLKYFQIPTSKDDPEYFEQKTTEYVSNAQVGELQNIVNGKGFPVDATLLAFATKKMNVQNIWCLPSERFAEAKEMIEALPPNEKKTKKEDPAE